MSQDTIALDGKNVMKESGEYGKYINAIGEYHVNKNHKSTNGMTEIALECN